MNKAAAALLFVLLFSAYLLTMSGHQYSMDGIAMYQQAKTLLFRHTLRFSPPFVWYDYRATYTYWPEGLSVVYLLPLAVFEYVIFPGDFTFRVTPDAPVILLNDPSYVYVSLTNGVITALTACILFGVAVRFGLSRRRSFFLALIYGLASPAFAYAKQDFAQPLAALLIMGALLLYVTACNTGRARTRYACLSIAGVVLGFLIMTRSETELIVAPAFVCFSFFQLMRARMRERLLTAFALLLPLSVLAVLHASIQHVKTGSYVGTQAEGFVSIGGIRSFFVALMGLLISPGRGLLVFFPLALYAPIGLRRMYSGPHRRWAVLLAGLIVFHILLFAFWACWWGGLSWGPRFLVPILPILTLMAFWPGAECRRPSPVRHCVAGLAKALVIMVGLVMTLSGVLLHWETILGRPWNVADTGGRYFRLESNVLWTNWRDLGHPEKYDLADTKGSPPRSIGGRSRPECKEVERGEIMTPGKTTGHWT